MGLNDEQEKFRQAAEWLKTGTGAQKLAAAEHLSHLLHFTTDADLRTKAFYALKGADEEARVSNQFVQCSHHYTGWGPWVYDGNGKDISYKDCTRITCGHQQDRKRPHQHQFEGKSCACGDRK